MQTFLAMLLAALALGSACTQSDWKVGRATFYGTDGWSIHQGSCGFYYIFEVCQAPVHFYCASIVKASTLSVVD